MKPEKVVRIFVNRYATTEINYLEGYDPNNVPTTKLMGLKNSVAITIFKEVNESLNLEIYLQRSNKGFKILPFNSEDILEEKLSDVKKKSFHNLDFYGIPIKPVSSIIKRADSDAIRDAKLVIYFWERTKKEYLFSIKPEWKSHLKEGEIDGDLVKILLNHDQPIAPNAIVSKLSMKSWKIEANPEKYIIKDSGVELNVYQERIIF